jgi:hypothetical protein
MLPRLNALLQGQRAAPVQPIEVPKRQFTYMHMVVGPLPASQSDYTYLFTIMDRATRRLEAYLILKNFIGF